MLRLAISPDLLRSDAETQALCNTHANRADYEYRIAEDALIIGPEGVIARLVTNCLDTDMVKEAAKHFRTVHGDGSNRGSIAGKDSMMNRFRVDGSLSFTKGVPLSIVKKMRERNEFTDFIGWMDVTKYADHRR